MWKDIILHIGNDGAGLALGGAVSALAAVHGATLQALITNPLPPAPYGPGASAMYDVYSQLCKDYSRNAAEAATRLEREYAISASILTMHADRVALDCASQFRSADLIVLAAPTPDADFIQSQVFDAALFQSGRPILVAPHDSGAIVGRDVVIAWKDCREAARATYDALPLLLRADRVRMIAVHGAEDERFFGRPAMDRMLALLQRHGVQATGASIAASKDGPSATLIDAAETADVIVMGAYGRWRMTEKLFGGMTKDMLANSPSPILMSH